MTDPTASPYLIRLRKLRETDAANKANAERILADLIAIDIDTGATDTYRMRELRRSQVTLRRSAAARVGHATRRLRQLDQVGHALQFATNEQLLRELADRLLARKHETE